MLCNSIRPVDFDMDSFGVDPWAENSRQRRTISVPGHNPAWSMKRVCSIVDILGQTQSFPRPNIIWCIFVGDVEALLGTVQNWGSLARCHVYAAYCSLQWKPVFSWFKAKHFFCRRSPMLMNRAVRKIMNLRSGKTEHVIGMYWCFTVLPKDWNGVFDVGN